MKKINDVNLNASSEQKEQESQRHFGSRDAFQLQEVESVAGVAPALADGNLLSTDEIANGSSRAGSIDPLEDTADTEQAIPTEGLCVAIAGALAFNVRGATRRSCSLGFCWIRVSDEAFRRLAESLGRSLFTATLDVLLVLFDRETGIRFELRDRQQMGFALDGENMAITPLQKHVLLAETTIARPTIEDPLATLGLRLREEDARSDSDAFVCVSIDGSEHEVMGTVTGREAKDYRPPNISARPGMA
jgi:hypothetical protein